MVHEVPDKKALFKQIYELLKTGGKLLIIEPAFHVKKDEFKGTIDCAHTNGFETQVFSSGFMDMEALLVKTG